MNKLRRFYNQNRKKIWMIGIIIVFGFLMLQLANTFVGKENDRELKNLQKQQERQTSSSANGSTSTTQLNGSTSTTRKKSEKEIINEFINYCNNKDLENAYNMLTDDCKSQMYSDLETFERIYYNNAFENKSKQAVIDNWDGHTYLVYLKENILSTGKIKDENQKGDYITVVTDKEGNTKININNYIGYKEIKKIAKDEKIQIEVEGKDTYVDYEEYKINIKNESTSDIKLDSLRDNSNIYIEDSNGVKYLAYTSELSETILTVPSGHSKQIKIKFFSAYTSNKKIKELVFLDFWKGNNSKNKFKIEF